MTKLNRLTVAAVLAISAGLVPAAAHALVGPSELDTAHRNVGVLLPSPAMTIPKVCGVTLVAPRVGAMAGHCVATRRALLGETRGTVTFDPDITDGVDTSTYDGDLLLDPLYSPNGTSGHDLGLIVFDQPVTGLTPEALPSPGWLDTARGNGTLSAAQLTLVGYGTTHRDPGNVFTAMGQRRSTTNTFQALTPNLLMTRAAAGQAASCDLDSGGAVFLGAQYAGVIVNGDAACSSLTGAERLDIAADQDWIHSVIDSTR